MNIARALLGWYDAAKRDLPWRRRASPYRTLVSELMLQQTVVATVVPYFERFVRRFPDIEALAQASEQDVLALWSGLGYYSRARNLHRAAQIVVSRYRGALPQDEAALADLPGIGPYTAAAIAAIAFGRPTFALDGNAARVMARLHGVALPIDRPDVRDQLRAAGQKLVPGARAGDFAQAVMELGAEVCVPRQPRCSSCPVRAGCQALAAGRTDQIPARTVKAPRRIVKLVCAAARHADAVLLVLRAPRTLLGGTWALPSTEPLPGESGPEAARRALAELGIVSAGLPRAAGTVRHIFTHRDVIARVFCAKLEARDNRAGDAATRWVRARELDSIPLSSFTRKTLELRRPEPASAHRG